jgi:hypothetical protein
VAAVGLWLILSSGGSTRKSTTSAASNAPAKRRSARAAAVNPSSVTVAVLNGTSTSGLAHRVGLRLAGDSYKEGTIATAADQTHSTTVVAYLPGFKRDAQAVANSLRVSASTIQPVDQSTQAVACPPPSACSANVVVTVGADLANIQ